jgi:BirA family biotin operon repressor/biotin-[acetyl-CoA-carboxylase] ligase
MEDSAAIIWLKLTDSTNDEARRRLDVLDNLSVVAARTQTSGRGQGDHTWTSEPGQNLTFTFVLKFPPCAPLAASEILRITQAVTHALREYLLSKGVAARIKWPNDIYVGDKKICGILIENILGGKQVAASMVGIGLNLNQSRFPADLPNPVSLRQVTGRRYDLREELVLLREELKKSASLLDSQEGRTELARYFDAYVFRKDA